MLFLAQLGSGGAVPAGFQLQSTGIHPAWMIMPLILFLMTLSICLWLLWRMRTLVRAVRELKSDEGKPVHIPGALGFLRFKLRTMLILVTLIAVPLTMFMVEFRRAQTQAQVLDRLEMATGEVEAHYELGLLGDGRFAASVGDWVHPHFGCRLVALKISTEDDTYHLQQADLLTELGDLETLSICGSELSQEDLMALASLPKLRRLQIWRAHLPREPLRFLTASRSLQDLQLDDCSINDDDLRGLAPNSCLVQLVLSTNYLDGTTLTELTQLGKLERLSLANNRINEESISKLAELPALTHLNVSNAEITQPKAIALSRFPALQRINITSDSKDRWKKEVQDIKREHKNLQVITDDDVDSFYEWTFEDNRPTMNHGYRGCYSFIPVVGRRGGGVF